MDANLLKGHLDLILLGIIEGPAKYGLEIAKAAQDETDGYFDLRVGSLYPALHRLEAAGWLRGEFRPAPRGGAPVKYYELTEHGERALADKRRAFATFSAHVRRLTGAG